MLYDHSDMSENAKADIEKQYGPFSIFLGFIAGLLP